MKSADSKITDVEITKFVAENAAPYKQLVKVFLNSSKIDIISYLFDKFQVGGVEFIEAIPKSNSGKILRKELKASFK